VLIVLLAGVAAIAAGASPPTSLQTENRVDPIGIDVAAPRLSWQISGRFQRAWQVRAATTVDVLRQGSADRWDSGRVDSSRSTGIAYAGLPLRSRERIAWQVRVWSGENESPSDWSDPAFFEMGLLNPADWRASWIEYPAWSYGQPLPLFARQFQMAKPVRRARLYITGLGVYLATLNGRPVTSDVLVPGNTNFDRQVEYATCDVGALLQSGPNTLGVQLGNGSFNAVATPGRYMKFVNAKSRSPRLLAQLEIEYTDGQSETIATDTAWRTALGATTTSTWYGGEDYDARREIAGWDQPGTDLTAWATASNSAPPSPDTKLAWRPAPPVRAFETITPVAIAQPKPGVYVFDFGVNFAGRQQLRVSGPAGTAVRMRIGELCNADGTVSQATTGSPIIDTYTLSGRGVETWAPRFEYHGFRYVEVTGLPSPPDTATLTGQVLRAANTVAGQFTSSNPLLNDIHRIIDRAIASNMMSIFTDCPDREKLGWLGDMQLIFDTIARNYDIAAYVRTIVRNMAEAQTEDGLVPDFVPEYTVYDGGFRDDPNWGNAMVLAPWSLYEIYGDSRTLEQYYPHMRRYLEYLRGLARGDLLDYGLGDWNSPDRSLPVGVTATYGYHRAASTMARAAELLGRTEDARAYAALADRIGAAFHERYFEPEGHTYAGGRQAADAIALDMGIVPAAERDAVLRHLVNSIRSADNHAIAGIVSLPALFRVLSAAGHDGVIFDIATATTNPSYGYQLSRGATALAEDWPGADTTGSQNHMMFGAIDEWFTGGLAGIRQAPGSAGFRSLVIRPAIVGDLTHVRGAYRTPHGEVVCEWTRTGTGLTIHLTIPSNTSANLVIPGDARAFAGRQGLTSARSAGGRTEFSLGPGRYVVYSHPFRASGL
jgi:alpha-L-rhamnosidase